MPISYQEFEALTVGESVRIISHKYGNATCSAGKVLARTKTGVKVELLATGRSFIFTRPDTVRGEKIFDAHRYLATAEDWQRAQAENRNKQLRCEAYELTDEFRAKIRRGSKNELLQLANKILDKVALIAK